MTFGNIIFNFFSEYDIQGIITYVGLFLAYLAYRKSILDDFNNWINLLKSFKSELKYASSWIGNSYSYEDQKWIMPSKLVYPLVFESVKTMLQKGCPPAEIISQNFLDKLAIFNERIKAFNHLLGGQIMNYVVNNENEQETKDKSMFLNKAIHLQLIGNQQTEALYSLYIYFDKEIAVVSATWKPKVPWYIRKIIIVSLVSFFCYLLIDFFI